MENISHEIYIYLPTHLPFLKPFIPLSRPQFPYVGNHGNKINST